MKHKNLFKIIGEYFDNRDKLFKLISKYFDGIILPILIFLSLVFLTYSIVSNCVRIKSKSCVSRTFTAFLSKESNKCGLINTHENTTLFLRSDTPKCICADINSKLSDDKKSCIPGSNEELSDAVDNLKRASDGYYSENGYYDLNYNTMRVFNLSHTEFNYMTNMEKIKYYVLSAKINYDSKKQNYAVSGYRYDGTLFCYDNKGAKILSSKDISLDGAGGSCKQ